MTIFYKVDFSPSRNVSRRKLTSLKHIKSPNSLIAQTFGRDAKYQKSLNLLYFHNRVSKKLPQNLHLGPCHIDPTKAIN